MSRVTAVITTHKRPPEIVERAIKSVLAQTHNDIQIIVVDDSPADYSARGAVKAVAENCGVLYLAHDTCQGACVARNTGLANATGDFIAFLDDDDEWKPEKIEKQLRCFTSEETALVYCGSETKNETTGAVTLNDTDYQSGWIYDKLIIRNFIGSTSFPLLRTGALRSIGGFDPLMQSAQDYDVWLRLTKKYQVAYVPESLVVYHVHAGEQISKNFSRRIKGLERLNEKNAEYLRQNRKAWWIRHIKLAPTYAGDGQLGRAMKIWLGAVLKCPGEAKENVRYLYRAIRAYAAGYKH